MLLDKCTHCFDCSNGKLTRYIIANKQWNREDAYYKCDTCDAVKTVTIKHDIKGLIGTCWYYFTDGRKKELGN